MSLLSSHVYEPQDGCDECRVCSMPQSTHGRELGPEIEDDPRPQFCARCPHVEHAGACPDALPAYPKARPCPCTGKSVAA